MSKQKSAFYNGIKFVDIDRQIDLPTDFETDRIPNKGDVICFNSIIGNESTYYHCIVLYVYDQKTILSKSIEDGEIFQTSIYVVTKKIEPELGEKTWKSILENIQHKNAKELFNEIDSTIENISLELRNKILKLYTILTGDTSLNELEN